MEIKSVLTPEGSIVAGMATIGLVYAVYSLDAGTVSTVHASDAHHPANMSSIKKAGLTSFAMVAAIGLLARDPNIVILGMGAIIAMDLHYKHAAMVNPANGQLEVPGPSSYSPAGAQLQAVS